MLHQDGATPLMEAAGNDNEAVVRLLVEKGADVNAKTKVSVTRGHSLVWQLSSFHLSVNRPEGKDWRRVRGKEGGLKEACTDTWRELPCPSAAHSFVFGPWPLYYPF